MAITDSQESALAKEYEYYYDKCEQANKTPLTFEAWLKEQKGGIDFAKDNT